jgi:hypothetical protein
VDIVSGTGDVLLGPHWHPAETLGGDELRMLTGDEMAYVPAVERIEHRVTVELESGHGAEHPQPVVLRVLGEDDRVLAETLVAGRRTIQFHLPAGPPKLHAMRFDVRRAPDPAAAPEHTLPSARVFSIRAEPLRPEVVPLLAGFRLGRGGWYVLEETGESTFRWVNDDAEIVVTGAGARTLELDVEPGPALRGEPLTLSVRERDDELARFVIAARRRIEVRLPDERDVPYSIVLHVVHGGMPLPGDQRVLNFRLFHIPPA